MTKRGILLAAALLAAAPVIADEIIPIPPCRVVDTRNPPIGFQVQGSTIDFGVRNDPDSPGPGQGGQANCGIPYNATGVFLNIIAIGPTATGWANLWPHGATEPTSSVLNVVANETVNVATLARLLPYGPATDLKLKNLGFGTHWAIDILGYTGRRRPPWSARESRSCSATRW